MSVKRKVKVPDPAELANKRVLADIKARDEAKKHEQALAADLGLNLKPPLPEAATAAEFLADEFERRAFGDQVPTYTRVLYGPDPLLTSCPAMKAAIEKVGLEEYANATAEAILLKESKAVTDPVMQRGLMAAIAKFGKAEVARAFKERILKIPVRTVEVEADREDPLIFSRPLEEAVERYGSPGMAPKFLSERCIAVLGLRGYRIVTDERGDPVKVGTLLMGEIPIAMAERRRRHWAEQSNELMESMEDDYRQSVESEVKNAGRGFASILTPGETVRSQAAGDFPDDPVLTESYLNRSRETGFRVERG
jgi:hypothetical protein